MSEAAQDQSYNVNLTANQTGASSGFDSSAHNLVPIASSVEVPSSPPCPCNSGLPFSACHGLTKPALPPVLEPPSSGKLVKLDLACGQSPREGFEGVDWWTVAQHKVDLMRFPWPWADESVDEIHCSHFVEHLHARYVTIDDLLEDHRNPMYVERFVGQDLLFAFFDECYRILKKGATMTVIVPSNRSDRAFQDPTHRRFIAPATFAYLAEDWRKLNRLDHYKVRCDFGSVVNHTILAELTVLNPEALARRYNESWNVVFDWVVTLHRK